MLQAEPIPHTCQYAYTFFDDTMTVTNYSTFLYFTGNGCVGIADIAIDVGTNYLRIDAWTPPYGTLNASLTLIP
jgi:hypothetical protein